MEGRLAPRMVLMGWQSSAVGFSISLTRRIVGYGCERFEFPAEYRCRLHTYKRAGGWTTDKNYLVDGTDTSFFILVEIMKKTK
jgi:hypothetical protein